MNTQELKAYRKGILDAADEVASHWNDRSTMTNQYDQAQRSANVLNKMAHKVSILNKCAKGEL